MMPMSLLCIAWKNSLIYAQLSTLAWAACGLFLEGRGANRGSVLQARCKCKGGRDGGCMNIAAAMYTVDW